MKMWPDSGSAEIELSEEGYRTLCRAQMWATYLLLGVPVLGCFSQSLQRKSVVYIYA